MTAVRRFLTEADILDRAVYVAVASTPSPSLDSALRRLSTAANRSRLWLATAAALALFGGRTGRRAAVEGTVAIGVTSAIANLVVKPMGPRARPNRAEGPWGRNRHVPMPSSSSFPSGHAASAFTFAAAAGSCAPTAAFPLHLLAGAVAYSRVHTGVHYPGDVIMGALLGTSVGHAVHHWLSRQAGLLPRRQSQPT